MDDDQPFRDAVAVRDLLMSERRALFTHCAMGDALSAENLERIVLLQRAVVSVEAVIVHEQSRRSVSWNT